MFRKNKNVPTLLAALKKAYPHPVCALNHKNAFELLSATILSAQCTDERVNKVTPALFKRFPDARSLSESSPTELEGLVRTTGFFRSKAKSLRGMASMLVAKHKGRVPDEMDELLELPGVARKTANVVLGTAFGRAEGVVVDTHVTRLSQRLGLTRESTPEKIERDLMKAVPREDWIWFSHALITHGRQVCRARNPDCPNCPVRRECANPVALVATRP